MLNQLELLTDAYGKSIDFTNKLITQLNTLDSATTLTELYHGRSLVQEIYNELNFQLWVLKSVPSDITTTARINEVISMATSLEDVSKIPWDGHSLLNNTT